MMNTTGVVTKGTADSFVPSIWSNIGMILHFRFSIRDSPELGRKVPTKRSSMHLQVVVLEATVVAGITTVEEIPEGEEDAGGAAEAAEAEVETTMIITTEVAVEGDVAETTIMETTKIIEEEVKITDRTIKKLSSRTLSFSNSQGSAALQLRRP